MRIHNWYDQPNTIPATSYQEKRKTIEIYMKFKKKLLWKVKTVFVYACISGWKLCYAVCSYISFESQLITKDE